VLFGWVRLVAERAGIGFVLAVHPAKDTRLASES
jgi:hypothetical protein